MSVLLNDTPMNKEYLIKLICKLPPKLKRRLMLRLEGNNVWIHGGGTFGIALKKAIDRFVPSEKQNDQVFVEQIVDDIKLCYVKYDLLPAEYFYFGFSEKDWTQRDSYLTDAEEDYILVKRIGYDKYLNDLSNKYHFYELAKPFFHRSILLFDEHTEKEGCQEFCLKVKRLFIKPLAGSEGDGSFTFDVNAINDASELYSKLLSSKKKWMIEERISQNEELARWNASSVNTVRLPTFLNTDGFFVLAPIFRTGRAGKAIDNTSAGGVFALIDPKTGRICSNGYDIYNNVYEVHPDSGLAFMGYQIPSWKELLQTAETAHRTFPTHLYIAWDFSLTDMGWELIEGNWGRFRGAQIAGGEGLKEPFMNHLKRKPIL